MANFGKYANLSKTGWTESTVTQAIPIGQTAHIGLWGGGPAKEELFVESNDPSICIVHELPANKAYPNWRHFVLTALQDGDTSIIATLPSGAAWASMKVSVTGKTGVKLVFFPGERLEGKTFMGTIYVIGGHGESMPAAGGPPAGRYDRGGHTIDPTPAGSYVLGPRIRVVAPSWPTSAIPWGAALRINKDGEAEFEASPGKWVVATGSKGVVTLAQQQFLAKDNLRPKLAVIVEQVRNTFINPVTKALHEATWSRNDFGRWGWNLRQGGKPTAYYLHTTPVDEAQTTKGLAVMLTNSHGCVHLVPEERDRMMAAGYLVEGTPFEVRPYTESGPP